jgi:hypothetical protein
MRLTKRGQRRIRKLSLDITNIKRDAWRVTYHALKVAQAQPAKNMKYWSLVVSSILESRIR